MPYKTGEIWTEATRQLLEARLRGEADRCFHPGKNPKRPAHCNRKVIVTDLQLAIPLGYCRRHWPRAAEKSRQTPIPVGG